MTAKRLLPFSSGHQLPAQAGPFTSHRRGSEPLTLSARPSNFVVVPGLDDSQKSHDGAALSGVLARWYAAWNAHDVAAISALMTDDVQYEDPSATSAVMNGRVAVEQHARSAFAGIPDLHLEKLEEWANPGEPVIASYFRFSGTFTAQLTAPGVPPLAPTDGRLELLGMDRSEIRQGRLARHQIFWDTGELGRQLGLFPLRGSRAERMGMRLQVLTARRLRRAALKAARPGSL